MLHSVVKLVGFSCTGMQNTFLIKCYCVVAVVITNYIEDLLEKYVEFFYDSGVVRVFVCVCRIDKMSAGQDVQEMLRRNLIISNHKVK